MTDFTFQQEKARANLNDAVANLHIAIIEAERAGLLPVATVLINGKVEVYVSKADKK